MVASRKWVGDLNNQRVVVSLYAEGELTTIQIAARLHTTVQNIIGTLKRALSIEEYRRLKKLRYVRSKIGPKNPMYGKFLEKHHLWQGKCSDGYGYLTQLHAGKRRFVHRIIMAQEFGLRELPAHLVVHHIDGNTENNVPDNLCICTRAGHIRMHYLLKK